jgi:hypothetical protein
LSNCAKIIRAEAKKVVFSAHANLEAAAKLTHPRAPKFPGDAVQQKAGFAQSDALG